MDLHIGERSMAEADNHIKAAKAAIHFINKAPLVGEEGPALFLAQSFLRAIAAGELLVLQQNEKRGTVSAIDGGDSDPNT